MREFLYKIRGSDRFFHIEKLREMKEENWPGDIITKIKEFQRIEKSKRIYLSKIKKTGKNKV